jgi:glycerate 2-kinase
MADTRQALLEIFQDALRAVDGCVRVREHLVAHPLALPVYLIAVGKAACPMARGAQAALGAGIRDALIVTKEGYTEPLPWPVREAGHPVPDARSLEAGEALTHFVATAPRDGHILVLLSGGASALIERLPAGVDLARLRRVTDWLLASGLDIGEMNRIRKRLSLIKGGRLAQWLAPRAVTCLAISDVPGDDPRAIGSGPLVADASLAKPLAAHLPDFVRAALDQAPAAPVPGDGCFDRVRFEIVARLDDAKRAAADAAAGRGYRGESVPEFIAGEAVEVGTRLARGLLEFQPGIVRVWGGETTVRLPRRPGRGGRNQSLALAAALELAGREDLFFLAAGTDGTDGPTQDAGALVDGGTVARGALHGLDAREALVRADAGTFLEASGDLIHTGPTGTNVMDLMLGLRVES